MIAGGCRCGAIRYEASGEIRHHAICHCRDCQMGSGAPMVAWLAVEAENFRVTTGEPVSYSADGNAIRQFCGKCGTPLFYINEMMLPGLVDVQTVTLDSPDDHAPAAQIQIAERRKWMSDLAQLPEFERFPGRPGD